MNNQCGSLKFSRIMTLGDIERAIPIGLQFHLESRYSHIKFSDQKFVRAYEKLIAKPDTTVGVLVERNGEVIGVMGAEIGEYYLGTGFLIATNYFIYVSNNIRGTALGGRVTLKLIRFFVDWGQAKGAQEFNIHVTSGINPDRTDRFLKRIGFLPYGGNYCATNSAGSIQNSAGLMSNDRLVV